MARKRVFSKVKAVKDMARERVGTPKSTRAIPDAKTKADRKGRKHKKTLAKMLEQE